MEDRIKILIADDEEEIVELLKSFLVSNNFICDIASNGKEVLLKIKENKYDIILLDVMMPYIDGYHVAYEISTAIDNPPYIIIMTSRDTQLEKGIAKMSGAYEIIQKPFDLDKILETIKKAVKEKTSKEEK